MESAGPSRSLSFAINTTLSRSEISEGDKRDSDTPGEGDDPISPQAIGLPAPVIPYTVRKKSRPRSGKGLSRHDSLQEAKVSISMPVQDLNYGRLYIFCFLKDTS